MNNFELKKEHFDHMTINLCEYIFTACKDYLDHTVKTFNKMVTVIICFLAFIFVFWFSLLAVTSFIYTEDPFSWIVKINIYLCLSILILFRFILKSIFRLSVVGGGRLPSKMVDDFLTLEGEDSESKYFNAVADNIIITQYKIGRNLSEIRRLKLDLKWYFFFFLLLLFIYLFLFYINYFMIFT